MDAVPDDSPLGYLVVGGVRASIVAMRFERGHLVVTGRCRPPARASTGPVTIFGTDGVGVCQGSCELTLPPTSDPLAVYDVTYELRVDRLV